jgi:2-polyprenyl-6-methoxyphenol hydroxylase-like FAD-dependent oxidoreductase
MKICISGAGIAGPALAHWLLRHGHEPTLVEIAPRFRDGGYIIDFWGKGFDLAERMGILPRVLDAGYRVREVRIVDEHGHRAGGFRTDSMVKTLGDRFVSLPRGELARIIHDTVSSHVETLFDDSITGLADSAEQVRVEFSRTPPRAFDLVIGADGLHSRVRRLAFPADSIKQEYLGYHVAAFEVTGYRPRDELTYVSFARPGRQIARFAMRDDRTVFLLIFAAPEPIETRDEAAQRAVLQETFGGLGWECDAILSAMERADSVYFDRVSQVHVRRWSRGRVALLGDAAHCPSLLAGEGCALAIIDAYILAGELARAPRDHAQAFAAYENRLRAFIEDKQRSARRFAGQFAPRTEFGIRLRNLATRAMALPGVTELFMGRALRDRIELPTY